MSVMQMDQSPFVKLDNVPEQEEITGATFTRSVVWFESKVSPSANAGTSVDVVKGFGPLSRMTLFSRDFGTMARMTLCQSDLFGTVRL